METVTVTKALLSRIDKTLQELHKNKRELLNRNQVCEVFGWSSKTLSNYLSEGKITDDMYIVSPVNGQMFFDKNKLLGL